MEPTLTLYHNPMSRGRIAHWMLEEVGVPYDVVLIDFAKGENKAAGFLALNPMGKIPTLVHGDVVVTEAAAICTYLADRFPSAGLAPALDDPRRATWLRWLFFGAGCVEPALVDRMFERPPPERPGALGYGTYADTLNALEGALSPGPFILGETFSAADVYIASEIGWGLITRSLEARPRFEAYFARCGERPAFKRFVARDEAFNEALAAKLKG
ncbi:MAG: glutathione S-transferase family protein [Myxococcota bacterium]